MQMVQQILQMVMDAMYRVRYNTGMNITATTTPLTHSSIPQIDGPFGRATLHLGRDGSIFVTASYEREDGTEWHSAFELPASAGDREADVLIELVNSYLGYEPGVVGQREELNTLILNLRASA